MTDKKFNELYKEVLSGRSINEIIESLSPEERADFGLRFSATEGRRLFAQVDEAMNGYNPYNYDLDRGKDRKKF